MFVIEIPYMNLNQIYNSGQVPRWIKLSDDKFIVIHKDKALKIEQKKDRFVMNCSEEEFFKIWFDYFDLSTDYMEINNQVKRLGNKFKIISNRGKGIHVVRQDDFESYIYSKIADKVGYELAKKAISHIAKVCGIKHVQSMREAGRVTWYEFPTPEMILKNFNKLGKMGKINKWLNNLCEAIINDQYEYAKNGNDLFYLFTNDKSKFPLSDVYDLLDRNFDCDANDFAEIYLNEIENKGVVYVYVLHHMLNPPKEMKKYGSY